MAYKTGILFGRITKINGYDGSVIIRLEKKFIENIPETGSVFLEIEGKPVPFFISEYDYPGSETIKITFEDYDTAEKIKQLKGSRVFLTSSEVFKDLSPEIPPLQGYTIFSHEMVPVGTVREVIHNPGQSLIVVDSPSKPEILIPIHEDLIISIDKKKKIIVITIPEGLTEINQNI